MNKSIYIASILSSLLMCAADAAADCGVVGDLNPENPCELCRGTAFESLPDRTACGDDRRVLCDGERVYRQECAGGVCLENERFGGVCPGGLTCDEIDHACLRVCSDETECQPGYECDEGVCRSAVVPCPADKQRSANDGACYDPCADGVCAGGFACNEEGLCLPVDAADMGQPASDMGQPPTDMGLTPDAGGGGSDQGGDDRNLTPTDEGGCTAAAGASPGGWSLLLFALAALGWRRR